MHSFAFLQVATEVYAQHSKVETSKRAKTDLREFAAPRGLIQSRLCVMNELFRYLSDVAVVFVALSAKSGAPTIEFRSACWSQWRRASSTRRELAFAPAMLLLLFSGNLFY